MMIFSHVFAYRSFKLVVVIIIRLVPERTTVSKVLRRSFLLVSQVFPIQMLTWKVLDRPIIVPFVLVPTENNGMLLGFTVGIVPPNVELLVDRVHAQVHGSTLFLKREFGEGLAIIGDVLVGVPRFLSVAHDFGGLLSARRKFFPPPISVVLRHHVSSCMTENEIQHKRNEVSQ